MIKQLVAGFVAGAVGVSVYAETKLSAEVTGGLMVSQDMDEFTVAQGGMGEQISGTGSFVGAAKLGGRTEIDQSSIGYFGVFGGYANSALTGVNVGAEVDYLYRTGEKPGAFAIGPYGGIGYYFSPNWTGDYGDFVEFDGTVGGYLGLKATFGNENVRAVLLFGYQFIQYDARGGNGGSVSSDELDMGGLVAQAGVQF